MLVPRHALHRCLLDPQVRDGPQMLVPRHALHRCLSDVQDNPAQTLSGGSVGLAPIPSNSTGTPTMMDDQTSQHVTSTSEAEVLSVAEEPGHAEIADEWSDDAFQDLVRDSSEWGADVLNSLSCIFSDFNVNNLQTPVCVATDLSVDVLQATVCATSDCRVPVRDVAYYRANIPRVPVRDVAYYRANIPRVPVREVAYDRASVPRIPVCDVADCSVDVPQVPVSTTSAPGLDVADCSVDVPQVTVCAISDCRDDAPQFTVCAISDCRDDVPQVTVCAISDCRDDVPQFTVCATSDCGDDVPQVTVCATSDCRDDVPQVTVCATSDCRDDVPQVTVCATSDCGVNVPHDGPTGDTVSPQLKQLEVNEIIDIGSCSYEIVRKLGEGGFGSVYAGICLKDGLEVALKFADNVGIEWIDIEGHPEPVPQEIGLLILANKGPWVPEIIQLLDWVEEAERYIMVLELPTPCENLIQFLDRHEGDIEEKVAKAIMKQATLAAQACCQRGVLHRDIKLENLLINPDTLEVKLIDFGCGEILTNAGYTSFAGTKQYCPPEFDLNGEYHGEPATVWSLGIVLFALLCGQFPKSEDLDELNDNIWTKDGLSQEGCKLLCSLLQRNPEKRPELDNVDLHDWFQYFICQPEEKIIGKSSSFWTGSKRQNDTLCYEIIRKLGEGGFGSVYSGIRLKDGLEVALKFADKGGLKWIDIVSTLFLPEGHPEPVPQEIGLLILANKGPWVPQIIQLLDWVEEPERYIMVLELPTPCENLFEFLDRHEGTLEENVVKAIMKQATLAAQVCCQRGVLHRDIKLENLLINPDNLEVKLIDFGCGEILTNAGYTSFAGMYYSSELQNVFLPGTKRYRPPEFDLNGEYHGEPATVWSLGILLFVLLGGNFPKSKDLDELNYNIWTKDGLSQGEILISAKDTYNSKSYKIEQSNTNGCVALKFADKVGLEWIDIEGHPEPVPQEIGLLILANKGPWVPQIIQLLDWVEEPEQYIMVLELPTPCENLFEFLDRHKGTLEENVVKAIMKQATLAAQACCQRGVLHRDIKLENLLINPDTLEVKLIDFGCGEILTNAGYTSFAGTELYCPPEFDLNGEYHGEPATVWSLGIVLFELLCGHFPESEDLDELNDNIWTKDGLSQDVGFSSYEIVRKLGEGDFGSVYSGVRLIDGLETSVSPAMKSAGSSVKETLEAFIQGFARKMALRRVDPGQLQVLAGLPSSAAPTVHLPPLSPSSILCQQGLALVGPFLNIFSKYQPDS
ncbi:unnamed protein product [Leuciscus chuanchicus]